MKSANFVTELGGERYMQPFGCMLAAGPARSSRVPQVSLLRPGIAQAKQYFIG